MRLDKETAKKIENEFFEYQGQRYHAGAKFTMHKINSYDKWSVVEASFRGYEDGNPDCLIVCYKEMNGKSLVGADIYKWVKRSEIENIIIDIVPGNYYTELAARKRYVKDSDIPVLVIGWVLYIFFMIGGMIFNGYFEGGWLLMTVIFFGWRHYLKTKEYYYYE